MGCQQLPLDVDMVFMEDIWIPCQSCDEKRFKPSILAIKYRGKNIDDVLRMTVDEAFDFFQGISNILFAASSPKR